MKRFLILFLLALPAFGQTTNGRWDWVADTTTGVGQMVPVLALPGAYVNYFINCTALPCTTAATTYISRTSTTACPSNAQVVWQTPVGSGCKAVADSNGNFGGWFHAGSYQYVLTISGHQNGPYAFDVGFGGGGGSGGCTTTGATNQAQGADGLGGCVPIVTQVNDVNLTTPLLPNFKNSSTVTFSKDSTNQISAAITPLAVQVEDSPTGVNQTILDFNSTTPAAPAGEVNCTWQNDLATGRKSCHVPTSGTVILPFVGAPVVGQYVILRPHAFTIDTQFGGGVIAGSGGSTTIPASAVSSGPSLCALNYEARGHWSGFTLADYGISAGSVTAVYAYAVSSKDANSTGRLCFGTPPENTPAITSLTAGVYDLQPTGGSSGVFNVGQVTKLTTFTGADIATGTVGIDLARSVETQMNTDFGVSDVGYIVYYTGSPVTTPNVYNILPPLTYTAESQSIGLDINFSPTIKATTVSALGSAALNFPHITWVWDGTSSTDCSVGGGTNYVACGSVLSGTSWIWQAQGGGGGGGSGTYFTETLTCTTTCALAHTPTEFNNLTVNGLTMIQGTDFTRSTTTITLTTPAVGGDVYYAQYHY